MFTIKSHILVVVRMNTDPAMTYANVFIGCTTVYPYGDPSLRPLELGASLFLPSDLNLWRASDEFNLTRSSFQNEDPTEGIWDGEKLVSTVSALAPLMQPPLIFV